MALPIKDIFFVLSECIKLGKAIAASIKKGADKNAKNKIKGDIVAGNRSRINDILRDL